MPHRRFVPRALVLSIGLLAIALVGVALAKTFTLKIAKNATVKNQSGASTHTSIVVNSKGRAVYLLTGDSSKHPECNTPGCLGAWPPVTAKSLKSLSDQHGIKGKLGLWRHNGIDQVTLGGHPLYTFAGDSARADATGEGVAINSTEIWHVRTPSGKVVSFSAASNGGGGGGGW
jgi:predicted lipoprotein with Yx(FWY)xxD motif